MVVLRYDPSEILAAIVPPEHLAALARAGSVQPERLRVIPTLERTTPLESALVSPEYSTNTWRAYSGLVQEDEWVAQ